MRRATSYSTGYPGICAHFYPRSPCGERPRSRAGWSWPSKNFYPRSPCGERLVMRMLSICSHRISIHALLAESDTHKAQACALDKHFYPRSPCGERLFKNPECENLLKISIHALLAESDGIRVFDQVRIFLFLSTLSLRRATRVAVLQHGVQQHFYPRSPCGERLRLRCCFQTGPAISIHALLAESDALMVIPIVPPSGFLSTLSLRRATVCKVGEHVIARFLSTLSLRRATGHQ